MSSAQEPLIREESYYDDTDDSVVSIEEKLQAQRHRRPSLAERLVLPLSIHLCIIAAYTFMAIAAGLFTKSSSIHGPELVYSPARASIYFEAHDYDVSSLHSSYVGQASKSIDQAWHHLLRYSNIRLSREEIDHIDPARAEQSVKLPDGGFYASLTATHELHCLKRLYQGLYPEYYFPDITEAEKQKNHQHSEHCIDMIRQSIMCHGDTTPITMRWGHTQRIPLENFSSRHECVNWDSLNRWAEQRQIPRLMEPGWLKHPTLGVVYHDGFENKIGQVDDH